jgi:hypothetical protein
MNRILHSTLRKHQLGIKLFLLICLNLAIAPAIYAANQGQLSQTQAYAIGLLLLATFAMSIYLFAVIFVPEKF